MLTQRMQVDVLAGMLEGLDAPVGTRVTEFDEPWRTVYQAIRAVPMEQRTLALREALAGGTDREKIIGTLLSATRIKSASVYQSLEEIAADLPPIEWAWANWIPRSMISMVAAVPGAGKTYVSLDLARRVSTPGESWPDGTPIMRYGKVIYIDAESVPQLLNERADDWKMDKKKLYLLMPDTGEMIDFGEQTWRDRLIEMTSALRPELVVIDSLGSISSRGENNVEDVRSLMGWLTRYALDFNLALVLIHHLRKKGSLQLMDLISMDDVRGSGHIVAAVRSLMGLSVIRDSDKADKNGPRRLEVLKTNLCRYPEPIGITFEPGYPKGVVLKYGDVPVKEKEASELDRCVEWLRDLLRGGPMRPSEVVEAGKQDGFGRSNIYKAR